MPEFLDLSAPCENQSFPMALLYDKPLLLKGFVCKVAQIKYSMCFILNRLYIIMQQCNRTLLVDKHSGVNDLIY